MNWMPCQTRARLILLLSAIVAAVGFARAQQPAIPGSYAPKKSGVSMRWSRAAASNEGWARFHEVTRVARFGFTATELSREKLNLQRGLQRSVIEKDKSPWSVS
jgi:hypothetical protein